MRVVPEARMIAVPSCPSRRASPSTIKEILSRAILQSSGSKLLDDAALASLERAAPFPPLPHSVASGPLELQVPFRFITR
jgi:TonB family protein